LRIGADAGSLLKSSGDADDRRMIQKHDDDWMPVHALFRIQLRTLFRGRGLMLTGKGDFFFKLAEFERELMIGVIFFGALISF